MTDKEHITNLEETIRQLKIEAENLKSVMVTAAEEIQEHWQAHCDAEGYGPSDLMHRLEKGLASDYEGYKPGEFTKLEALLASRDSELSELRQQAKRDFNRINELEDIIILLAVH